MENNTEQDINLRFSILQEAAKAYGPRLQVKTVKEATREIIETAEQFYKFVIDKK